MKATKIFLATLFIALLTISAVCYADSSTMTPTVGKAPIGVDIRYEAVDLSELLGDSASAVDAFVLEPETGSIRVLVPRTTVGELYIVTSGSFLGLYGLVDEVIVPMTEPTVEIELNGISYTITYLSSLVTLSEATVHEAFATSIVGEDSAFLMEVEEGETGAVLKNDAVKYTGTETTIDGYRLYFTSDGELVLYESSGNIAGLDHPGTVYFRAVESSDTRITKERERAVSGASETGEFLDSPTEDCHDGDAGSDVYISASYAYDASGRVVEDFCAYADSKHVLHEAYCDTEIGLAIEEHVCDECIAGACGPEIGEREEPSKFCFETDYVGMLKGSDARKQKQMFTTLGVTVGFYSTADGKDFGVWKDTCSDSKKLVEYHCGTDGRARFLTAICGSKCYEGKCSDLPVCWDSDGGENPNAKGTVSVVLERETGPHVEKSHDACSGGVLTEYYCDESAPGLVASKEITCEESCSGGRCMRGPQPCSGVEDCGEEEYCLGGYCSEGECGDDINCDIGEVCSDGLCVDEDIDYYNINDVLAALDRRLARARALDAIADDLLMGGIEITTLPPTVHLTPTTPGVEIRDDIIVDELVPGVEDEIQTLTFRERFSNLFF